MIPPKDQVSIWFSSPPTLICMPQIAKRFIFSESCSVISIQLRRGVSDVTLKSIKIRLGPSSLIDLDYLRLTLH
jgi:hypothetical protein